MKTYHRGGGAAIFVHQSLCYIKRNDLCINYEATESLSVEKVSNEIRNINFNIVYRPTGGDLAVCESYFQSILSNDLTIDKNMILAGNFNINVLDFEQHKNVQNFFNVKFHFCFVPTINKPTRVTNKAITAIAYIITDSIFNPFQSSVTFLYTLIASENQRFLTFSGDIEM